LKFSPIYCDTLKKFKTANFHFSGMFKSGRALHQGTPGETPTKSTGFYLKELSQAGSQFVKAATFQFAFLNLKSHIVFTARFSIGQLVKLF